MIQVIRRLQFCAGHRVVGHEGKCRHPHGHNYNVYLHAVSAADDELDAIGRVIDFGLLKEKIGSWIDTNWDHAFIVWASDKDLLNSLKALNARVFVLPMNPTAENIAKYLLYSVCPQLIKDPIEIRQVDVEETENCMALIKRED